MFIIILLNINLLLNILKVFFYANMWLIHLTNKTLKHETQYAKANTTKCHHIIVYSLQQSSFTSNINYSVATMQSKDLFTRSTNFPC